MLDFLLNGLAVYFCWAGTETLLLLSYLLGSVITAPLWLIAGVQDWRDCEVSGYICLDISIITALHALLFSSWFHFIAVLMCMFFTFRDKEIRIVGQADFVLFAHWLTIYMTVHGSGCGMFMIASIIFLVCLVMYMFIYKDKDGKRWHFGKMVPIIPPYAVAVIVTTLLQWPLSYTLFWHGW